MKKDKTPITAEIERLKAKVEMLSKAREAINDRISALSERVGEIRNALVEHEREEALDKKRTEEVLNLVDEIKPDEITKKIMKFEAKIETLKARIDGEESMLNKITEELKEIRRAFLNFKKVDELAKLAIEFKKDLSQARKIEAEVSKHSAKTEHIFLETEKKFEDLLLTKKEVEEMLEKLKDASKEIEKIKLLLLDFPKKEKLMEIKKELESRIDHNEREILRLEDVKKTLEGSVKNLSKNIKDLSKELLKNRKRIETISKKLDKLKGKKNKL